MSVSQLTENFLLTTNPVPKLSIANTAAPLFDSGQFTFMCWALHTGINGSDYSDLIAISDNNDVIGIGLKRIPPGSGTANFLNIGDLNSDITDTIQVPNDEWHHYTLSVGDIAGLSTRSIGYLDGIERVTGSLINPVTPLFARFWNSRASPTDNGAVWVGHIAGVKIWNGPALDPAEIQREMWCLAPIRMKNLWAWTPLENRGALGHNYAGQAGVDWVIEDGQNALATGVLEPPGVTWDAPQQRRDPALFQLIPDPPPTPMKSYQRESIQQRMAL